MKRQASVGMFYLYTFLVVIIIAALTSCASTQGCGYNKAQKYNQRQHRKAARYYRHAENSIHNPENAEFVVEVAFNEGIKTTEVTQEMFNARYGVE
jgi:hypothetical protein